MTLRTALAAILLALMPVAAGADVPVPTPPPGPYTIPEPAPKADFYKSVSPRQMLELLTAMGARDVREMGAFDGTFVWAETVDGALEVGFTYCDGAPNPCGYVLMRRYRELPLKPAQLSEFNNQQGLTYIIRDAGGGDVMLVHPVSAGSGLPRAYILSTVAKMKGFAAFFEAYAMKTWHLKKDQFYQHVE